MRRSDDVRDLRGLIARLPDALYRIRIWPSFGIDFVSEAVAGQTGYTPEELRADPNRVFRFVHPDDRHLIEERVKVGPTPSAIVLRWQRKDGQTVWVEHRETPIHDRSGRLIAIEGIAREIPDPTRGSNASVRLLDGVRVDLADQSVYVDRRRVRLTPLEYRLLVCLTSRPRTVLTRAELMRSLWRTRHTGNSHACETYIATLRRKIERDPRLPKRIVTVRGRGYKYVPA